MSDKDEEITRQKHLFTEGNQLLDYLAVKYLNGKIPIDYFRDMMASATHLITMFERCAKRQEKEEMTPIMVKFKKSKKDETQIVFKLSDVPEDGSSIVKGDYTISREGGNMKVSRI